LNDADGQQRSKLSVDNSSAEFTLSNRDSGDNTNKIQFLVNVNDFISPSLALYSNQYEKTVELKGDANSGGKISISAPDDQGTLTELISIVAKETATTGSEIKMKDIAGNTTIEIDADYNGNGRIITDELEIKGGSDFAEHFDIIDESLTPIPGMVVSIDPNSSGKLTISKEAYDKKVAGIISGANGVETGLFMGQKGSIAYGDYPIALTGRVYVYANDEGGKIKPGDLLTTSSTSGFAMKVEDHTKAQGAIIGKAMTEADENGFVLVLVNLQ
jgi:hypothetical protein